MDFFNKGSEQFSLSRVVAAAGSEGGVLFEHREEDLGKHLRAQSGAQLFEQTVEQVLVLPRRHAYTDGLT